MTTYRLTKQLNWSELHNERVRIDVSENYVIATKKDGSFVILAQAVRHREDKAEPPEAPVTTETTPDKDVPF